MNPYAILPLICSFLFVYPVLADPVGNLVRLQGEGSLERGAESQPLAQGLQLFQGDVIRTEEGSRALIRFKDGMELTLGASSKTKIERYLFDEEARRGDASLELDGVFRTVSGRIGELGPERVRLVTPVAMLGLRGTDVWGGPLDGQLDVVVFSGEVRVATAGGEVLLGSGEGTVIRDPDEPPAPARRWGAPKIDRALAALAFE